jgi:hypothetical protein
MNPTEIAYQRLFSQQLVNPDLSSPKEIVSWMGAMQAQDFPMAKWAVGARLPGSIEAIIETAINQGEILRTHLLRPTWHFVAPEDIRWMLDLSAAQIKKAQSSRDRVLGLTEEVYSHSNRVVEEALRDADYLTREALVKELNKAGIATHHNRASHLLARAEIEKIICSGAILHGKPTYALLDERVPNAKELLREEALAELARRYFTSRSPATLQDFIWWSGLPARAALQGVELIRSELITEVVDGVTYWLTADGPTRLQMQPVVQLLPTYDELIISYTDRSAPIPSGLEKHMKQISDRGVFRPIIVFNGQVIGIWKRTVVKENMMLEIQLFPTDNSLPLDLIRKAADQYGRFSGKQITLTM